MNTQPRHKRLKSGIYEIRNLITGCLYIGSASDLNKRSRVHRLKLLRNEHHAAYLQRSWNLHGEDNFQFNVLLYCDKENLIYFEQRFIDYYNPEYNSSKTAGNCLGYKHTEETRKKLSQVRIGNRNSVGSKGCVGRVYSEETRRKISEAHKGNKYWAGKHHTEETKQKLAAAHLGKEPANKGKKFPEISEQKKQYWIQWRLDRGLPPEPQYPISERKGYKEAQMQPRLAL